MGLLIPYLGVKPRVGTKVFIASTAVVVGDVTIGDLSSIWFNTVIRGDVEPIVIGKYTNLQDNVVVHGTRGKYNVEIGDYVSVGHNASIHGSKICSHVIVGIGAVVLDGSEIGEYCIIGAGALVPPGTKVEPESVVLGVPGKIVRKISLEEREMIERNWKNYVEYAGNYLEGK